MSFRVRWVMRLLLISSFLIYHNADAASEAWSGVNTSAESWRGFNLGTNGIPSRGLSDFQALRATGANLVRIALHSQHANGSDTYTLTPADWAFMDMVVAAGEKLGFRVVITLAPQPGGPKAEYWHSPAQQASIANLWSQIAAHFKGNTTIAGFDLINEPVPPGGSGSVGKLIGLADKVLNKLGETTSQPANPIAVQAQAWSSFAGQLIQAIRQQDPNRTVIVEPAPWGHAEGFAYQPKLPYGNVVYSLHFYDPFVLTHQGIYGNPPGVPYPSGPWNQAWLSQKLAPVRDFAQKYGVPVYVGEFSIIRWAPGKSRENYLNDLIPLFDAQGWPWTYHAFRGYQGWIAELAGDLPRHLKNAEPLYSSQTGTMQLLKSYFKHNSP